MSVNKYNVDEKDTKFSLNNLQRGFKYLKPHTRKLLLIFILRLIITFIDLAVIKLFEYAIDDVLPNKNLKLLIILSIGLVIAYFINHFINIIEGKKKNLLNQEIIEKLKLDMFTHIQYLSFDFYNSVPHGKIFLRLSEYAEDVSSFITYRLLDTILNILSLGIVIVFMFTTNVTLSIVSMGGVLLIVIMYMITTPLKRKIKLNVNNKRSNMTAYTLETIKGVLTTQSFNREEKNTQIVEKLNNEYYDAGRPGLWIGNLGWAVTEVVDLCTYILLFVIGMIFLHPNVSTGIIIAMGSYSYRFYNPIKGLFKTIDNSTDSITYLERILELLDEEIEIKDHENSRDTRIYGDIRFENVSFGYSKDKKVLDNVSFHVKQNERVAIVGETGSGKTTITNLLARFYEKDSGKILIDGVDVNDIKIQRLRKEVNVMLQDNFLFSMSIMENLKIGKPKITDKEVINICKKLKIHKWIESFDKGYKTFLKNGGDELSQGQRQLLCYARTIIADPKVLILDEATSKIDTKTEKMIKDSLNVLFQDRTCIIIAHRLSTIVDCDRIMLVKNHKIYESGTHCELMAKKGEYFKLYISSMVE